MYDPVTNRHHGKKLSMDHADGQQICCYGQPGAESYRHTITDRPVLCRADPHAITDRPVSCHADTHAVLDRPVSCRTDMHAVTYGIVSCRADR